MRRAEQLSEVADPFAEPHRGGVTEVNDEGYSTNRALQQQGIYGTKKGCRVVLLASCWQLGFG
jgi:hypothetical protein